MDNLRVIVTLALSAATLVSTAVTNTIAGNKERAKLEEAEAKKEAATAEQQPAPQPIVAPLANPNPQTVAQQAAVTHFNVQQPIPPVNLNPGVVVIGYDQNGQPIYGAAQQFQFQPQPQA